MLAAILLRTTNTPSRNTIGEGALDISFTRLDRRIREWMRDTLVRLSPRFDRRLIVSLSSGQLEALPLLETLGFWVGAVMLGGQPGRCLEKLTRRYRSALEWSPDVLGLTLHELRAADIAPCRSILAANLRRDPAHTWHLDTSSFRENVEDAMHRYARDRRGDIAFTVIADRRNRVRGYFAIPILESPLLGVYSGLEPQLHPSLHGRGISKYVYAYALRFMLARGVDSFTGSTSQRGVMALARHMGRRLQGVMLGHGPDRFPPGHFGDFL